MTAVLTKQIIYEVNYMWNFTFLGYPPDVDTNSLNSAKDYFKSLSEVYGSANTLIVPNKYLFAGSLINVVLTAKAALFDSVTTTATYSFSISKYSPTVSFLQRSQYVQQIEGGKRTTIPISFSNLQCSKSNIKKIVAPAQVSFAIYSGSSISSLTTRESDIENITNIQFQNSQTLFISTSQGYKYLTYYQITATITDLSSGNSNSDSQIYYIVKPPLQSIITGGNTVVSLLQNVVLSGVNSVIPETIGDTVSYEWKCVSCLSYQPGITCVCPILTYTTLRQTNLIILNAKLVANTKYTFGLTVKTAYFSYFRSAYNETDFITTSGKVTPLSINVLRGNINDVYLTLSLSTTTSVLSYNWTLLEVKDLSSKVIYDYNKRNTYFASYLSLSGNTLNATTLANDNEPPAYLVPNLTTTTNGRVLGIDKRTLQTNNMYVYAVSVNYSDNSQSMSFASFRNYPIPSARYFSVSPTSGIGFTTLFTFTINQLAAVGIDQGEYQIFKADCANSSELLPVTKILSPLNSYTLLLAPGKKECNNTVQIVLRTYESGNFIDTSTYVTVTSSQDTNENIFQDQIQKILSSQSMQTVDQKISILSEIGSLEITESSTTASSFLNSTIYAISLLDNFTGNTMDSMNDHEKLLLLNTTTSIIRKIIKNQATNLNVTHLTTINEKIGNYVNNISLIADGTSILPNCFIALGELVAQARKIQTNSSFFLSTQTIYNQIRDAKFAEVQMLGSAFSLSSSSFDLIVQKFSTTQFNGTINFKTEKGASLVLPNGMFNSSNLRSIASSDQVSIGSAIYLSSFNPYEAIKGNTYVNTSILNTIFGVTPKDITTIYDDLSKGIDDGINNSQALEPGLIQAYFTAYQVALNSTETKISSPLVIGNLPKSSYAFLEWPIQFDVMSVYNSSIILPVSYIASNKSWSNSWCSFVSPTTSEYKLRSQCTQIGEPIQTTRLLSMIPTDNNTQPAFCASIDIIQNAQSIIALIRLRYAFNVGPIAAIAAFVGLLLTIQLLLYKKDKYDITTATFKSLEDWGSPNPPKIQQGLLYDIYQILVDIRKIGLLKISQQNSQEVLPGPGNVVSQDTNLCCSPKDAALASNGFSKLSNIEEKNIKYLQLDYNECKLWFNGDEMRAVMQEDIMEDNVLVRITQSSLENQYLNSPFTCCSFIKVIFNINF